MKIFFGLAALFAASAAFHLLAIIVPSVDASAPPWRHAVFLAINLACAAGFAWRPTGRAGDAFTVAFAVLCAQQLVSHGRELSTVWSASHRVDVNSVGVLLVMPLTLALLVTRRPRETRDRSRPRGQDPRW